MAPLTRSAALAFALAAALVAAGCGDSPAIEVGAAVSPRASTAADPVWSAPPVDPSRPVFTADGTVLQSPGAGAVLCPSVVSSWVTTASEPPPSCQGVDLVGWDWSAVVGEQADQGVTLGQYRVVGAWGGTGLTLTEPPVGAPSASGARPGAAVSACPAPPGGWPEPDPAVTTLPMYEEVQAVAAADPGYAGMFVDSKPAAGVPVGAAGPDAFEYYVLGFRTTGDIEAFRAKLEAVYNGPLCVLPAARTLADLAALQGQVTGPGVIMTSIDPVAGVVTVEVLVSDQATLDSFAQRFGDAVRVSGWLHPLP